MVMATATSSAENYVPSKRRDSHSTLIVGIHCKLGTWFWICRYNVVIILECWALSSPHQVHAWCMSDWSCIDHGQTEILNLPKIGYVNVLYYTCCSTWMYVRSLSSYLLRVKLNRGSTGYCNPLDHLQLYILWSLITGILIYSTHRPSFNASEDFEFR